MFSKCFWVALLSFGLVSSAVACESFISIPADQAQKLLDALSSQNAKPLERITAFGALACSDIPAVRGLALKEAIKSNSDPILRGQALLEALAQKDGIKVDLLGATDLPQNERRWIDNQGGALTYTFRYKDRKKACISLQYLDKCSIDYQLVVSSLKVHIKYSQLVGEFILQSDNSMRGFVKPDKNSRLVSAKFDIF